MVTGFNAIALMTNAALVAATSVGLTLVVRRLPPVSGWVKRGLKPWACNVCSATWSSLAFTIALGLVTQDAWATATWLPALAIATWGLHHADPPEPPDFSALIPESEP